jgi:hypothetical protein
MAFLNLFAEENILLKTKLENPISIKVKKNKAGIRNSLSFIEVAEDRETLSSLNGLSTIKLKFKSEGTLLSVKEFTIDKKKIYTNTISQIAEGFLLKSFKGTTKKGKPLFQKITYDKSGNILSIEYLDDMNKPSIDQNGFSKLIFSYNKFGKKKTAEFFDLLEKPREDKFGIAKYEYAYDVFGNLLKTKIYSANNKPAADKYGIFEENFIYDYTNDLSGKLVMKEFFDKEGKPKADRLGISKYIYSYNSQGKKTLEEFRNEKGNLIEDKKGFARYVWEYNEKNELLLEEEYGKNGKLKDDPTDNVAKTINQYIKKDNEEITVSSFYNSENKLVLNSVIGAAEVRKVQSLLKNGYQVTEEYFSPEKEKINCLEGYHFLLKRFDISNNQVYEEYRDSSEKLIASKEGYAKYKADYNGKNLLVEEYLTADDKLAEGDDGFAKQIRNYDKTGNLLSVENFDSENKLAASEFGYAKHILKYNASGEKISEEFTDKNNQLILNHEGIAKINYTYNRSCIAKKKQGDCISKIEYFSKDQKLINTKKGFAKEENFYNEDGDLISKKFYNEKNALKTNLEFMYFQNYKKETAIEHFRENALNRGVYYLYLLNPYNKSKMIKISLNTFLRPIKLEEENFQD